jgi:ketosteroid isomerase-like protein
VPGAFPSPRRMDERAAGRCQVLFHADGGVAERCQVLFQEVPGTFRRLAPAWLLAALLAGACASIGGATADRLVDVEHRWVEALAAHDTAALDDLLADDFIDSTFRGGIRTKPEILTGPPAGGAYRSTGLEELKVRRYGRTAVVTGVNVLRGPGGDVAHVRFTDVFVLESGRWRAVSAQETLQETQR